MKNKNRELKIATAKSKTSARWTNSYTTIQELTEKAYNPVTINLTQAEYRALTKDEKDTIKDVGGFVGGHLRNGRRRKGHVLSRSFITLDIDNLPNDVDLPLHLADIPCSWLAHTTMSHTSTAPRWRLWVWLDRDVTPDEYAAISRRLAQDINPGLDWFDHTTFEPERLMYNPSTLTDSDYRSEVSSGKDPLDPDEQLLRFDNWQDTTLWPGITPDDARRHEYAGTEVQDPRQRPGIIGAFNRAWPIEKAIRHFLPNVYKPGTVKNRWTYTQGTSSNGLIIYDNGLHCYSQHATDPASEQMVNAFDLVRIHKYADLDSDAKPDTPVTRLPSYKAMTDLALEDTATKRENAAGTINKIKEVFTTIDTQQPATEEATEVDTPSSTAWVENLEVTRGGEFKDTLENFITIFTHDPRYNHISWNQHTENLQVQDPQKLPWTQLKPGWTDNDTAQLKANLAHNYQNLYSPTKMNDALLATATTRAFHPVRDWFNTLPPWDGTPRLDTLLVTTLGADDTDYTRAVTRKALVAAVRRTFHPGTKFDNVLILVGPQGVGKSTIFNRLAGQWFSDSLTVTDMKSKDGAEKLAGILIMEIAELAGMRKTDAETLKGFISRTDDKYRPAYARTVESHPRQGIIVGSTNAEDGFLRDPTGGRRFWGVKVTGHGKTPAWTLSEEYIQQIWAEALHQEKQGEKLYLEGAVSEAALQHQADSIEADDRVGLVAEYLDKKLPATWDALPLGVRRIWLDGGGLPDHYKAGALWNQFIDRTTVSKIEIWSECFGNDPEDMKRTDSYEIAAIMQQINGWEDSGRRTRLPIYGMQRVFERANVRIESAA